MSLALLLSALLLVQTGGNAMEQFFVGRTEGVGTVRVIMSGRHGVSDTTRGRIERGTLVLDQVVREEGKPARHRTWRLTRSGTRVTGTITDVTGAVTGDLTWFLHGLFG